MPVIDSNGVTIDAEISGPEGAPVLLLSNSLGTTRHMWDPQMRAFSEKFRVLRYDRRGHGKSAVPKGPYNMEMLGRDVIAVLDGLGIEKANWLGLSMGGMEGMWLGANAGNRFDKIILSNTSSHYPDKTMWHNRMDAVTKAGSLDVTKIAYAMEGLEHKDFLGYDSVMRKDDHQIVSAYYVGVFKKGVKYDSEKTGLGWGTESTILAKDLMQPTTCKMNRPK